MKKSLSVLVLGALVLVFGNSYVQGFMPYSSSSAGQSSFVVSIREDGTCSVTNTASQPRKQLEAQVRAMERYNSMSDDESASDAAPSGKSEKTQPAPMTDEELLKKCRDMYEQRGSRFGTSRENWKVEKVEADGTNQVRVIVSAAFPSIKDMLSQGVHMWGPSLLMMDESTVQIDTNNLLTVTFSRDAESAGMSYAATQADRYLKRIRSRQEWKLVLPGKITKSDFPVTDNNSTSIVLDPQNPETIAAVTKLIKLPSVTVAAEPAGLKVTGVLKSSELTEQMRSTAANEPKIPVTDAGPGFVTEAQSIQITTVHEFPEAKQLKENRNFMAFSHGENEGTSVSVKLFPPKGRIIKSVSGVEVKQAKDDQRRPVPTLGKARHSSYSMHSGVDGGKALTVRLDLGLPDPDAKAIDELQAEAIVLTIGGYKEMVLTNAQAVLKKEIDLASILPGAKLVIEKASTKGPQKSLDLTITGPNEIRQMEFTTGPEDSNSGHSSSSERKVSENGGIVTRSVQIRSYEFSMNGKPKDIPVQLKVRMPQDYKNERLQFTVTALDLL